MSDSASKWQAARTETTRVLLALGIALLVAFALILAISAEPMTAFRTLVTGPLSSTRTLGLWVDDAAKLTVAGLAFALVFQAQQFSLGVQGQAMIGGLCAGMIALSPIGASWAAIPITLGAAMLAGAAYGWIPGYAKAKLGANEIVASLMLNYLAINLVNYVVRNFYAAPGQIKSADFPPTAKFPALIANTRIDIGLPLAIIAVLVVWYVLYRTAWGVKLRLVGHNARFAEYAGIRANFIMISAMTVSGALAGLLGAMFVQGRAFGNLAINFEGAMSFGGILVAILARNNPLAIPLVAIGYGYLRQGSAIMGLRSDVPSEVIEIVQAVVILLAASTFTATGLGWWARVFKAVTRRAKA